MTEETENRALIVRGRYDPTVPERALIERGLALAESLGKKEYICPILKARFVLIPPGTFMMGSPENEPERHPWQETLHQVTISKPFYMQTTPMTQGQWQRVMGNNPSFFKGDDNLPVEQVSWNDVQDFIGMLNQHEGTVKYRLPTEAEWEYACRVGSTPAYCFGDDPGGFGEYAWYGDNSGYETHPVGQKKPNAWGLYDMHGNVWEWVQDWHGYGGQYPSGHVTDPTGPSSLESSSGSGRVIRGGSWRYSASDYLAGDSGSGGPETRVNELGFRLLAMANRPSQPTVGETARDGRFIAYNNGTVLDTSTNLMWAAKDNGYGLIWADAVFYCENYRGGGYTDWRMPTMNELAGLYDNFKTYKADRGFLFRADVHLTELIHLTCVDVWASDIRVSDAAVFSFVDGPHTYSPQSWSSLRALPVRSRSAK